ncbi:putative bifunctional diguanylate cyclase/phosphodiesterase [Sphingomicrobium lutaoense]|uniref:Diguanylate cyclase (GGDEF)-like protein/PAS domain S-box-containing protein n=1 Tax=Sphingomicrobium lutaoense TaxID=515949 RepID=A0A839Z394_9SPHN|nr:EAL domain-containing protein [Sphingomicrobium lutaoense]MBB3765018.1 diguanylate cyclase (GGDEF)-like protein/PAS domain S-box-containing protein [Sphingomicrobium lutaoense]
MYKAPDRYKRMISARLPDGESLGVSTFADDRSSSPLRDVQLIARAQFAPLFSIANIVAALLVAAALHSALDMAQVMGWILLVASANVLSMMWARKQAVTHIGRSGRKVPMAVLVGDVVLRGLAWLSLPLFSFASLAPPEQVILGSIMAGLGVAALGLVVIPICVMAWMALFTAGLCYAMVIARSGIPFEHMLSILFILGVSIVGVVHVARWAFGQLKTTADFGTQSESANLLLQEYEKRGVGWLWQVDDENRVTYLSSRMVALLGKPSSQVIGQNFPGLLGEHKELGSVLLEKKPFTNLEMEVSSRRGSRWISISGDPIVDTAGRFEGFRGVGSDITEVRATQERLTNLANMDVLSGLPNRGRVRQLLGEALRTANQSNVPCAIMFLDLDGFKPVNDTFGHPKGDAVLQAVAKRLCNEVGDLGHVGRMGGDEFAIVIKDAQSRKNIETLAASIITAIKEPYIIDETEIRIGVSIGCAFGPIDGATVDDLILKADLALYEAKGAGRGVAKYFSSELQSEQDDRVRLESDLRAAVASKQFHLLYQPLVSAKDQKLVGFEALIRWQHPTRGLIPPPVFIPIAEECGLMMQIGEWVITEACRTISQWPEPITVAVNISPKQICMPALPNIVSQCLARYKVPGNRIELEVTEGVFLGNNTVTLDNLKRLRQLGVGIALDDFGTGYSSIGYLNKAVFHKLKIDGSFVREAGTREENVAIIQSIVQLAKSFRMNVTAEGVETAEDFERMRDLGVDTIQGYLFGRPLAFDRADQMVRGMVRQKAS